MSETTPPPGVPGATPEPPKPADAAQKKQTVRISLPPKPAGGPSIRLPAVGAAPVPAAATAAPAAPRPAAPVAPAAPASAMGLSGQAKPAMPSTPTGKPAPAPRPAVPARASASGLDVGLAFATVLCSLATVAALFLTQPIQ